MAKNYSKMRTYTERTQRRLGQSDSEWQELRRFLQRNVSRFEQSREMYGIEEPRPEITDEYPPQFKPWGWVGRYPGDIIVLPGKLSKPEYEQLLADVAGWLEMVSVPTAAAVLPIIARRSIEPQAMVLGYSQALIDLTEAVLAHRPHIEVSREPTTGPEMQGRLLVEQTIAEWGSGNKELVSEQTEFSVETLPNLLVVRFHLALAEALNEVRVGRLSLDTRFENHRQYHLQFLEEGLPAELLDTAIGTEFEDSSVLAATQAACSGELAEIVDLWEAFQTDSALSISFDEQLTLGVKPISKVYEVWVLQVLVSEIASFYDEPPRVSDKSIETIDFGPSVTLHYDKAHEEKSQHLDIFVDNPGRPDYVITVDGRITWIGDAKFRPRRNINLEDYQRLFSYAGDLFPKGANRCVSVFYPDKATTAMRSSGGLFDVEHIALRPAALESQRDEVAALVREALKSSDSE
ncbi:hypothetical protein V5735_13065 (plasmid) [Haladaptatus sp. SPP-AMP-3]|uniref:hypothetical protein n=1 Tax=Haladaptatus sp. SPP-AMP-3 TaxID=3121295 RepID=UPI003C2D8B2A